MEFLAGLLFLALLVALVAFVLYRAHTHDVRDASTAGLWAGWAQRHGHRFDKGGRRRNVVCTMHGRFEGMPFEVEVWRSPGDGTLRVRVRAKATEPRALAFAVVAPKGESAHWPAGYVAHATEDAAFGHAFDVSAPAGEAAAAALTTTLDARFRSTLLRFPLPLVSPQLVVRYEGEGADVTWPTEEPHDAEVDAAVAILLVACPVTKAAKKKMNGTARH